MYPPLPIEEVQIRLTPPKVVTFLIAILAIALGIVLHQGWYSIESLDRWDFWLSAGGGLLLALGCVFKGL